MGGSFFKSSSSSSSKSFKTYSNSPSVRVKHRTYVTPSRDADGKVTNDEGGFVFLFMVGIMGVIYVVCRCRENSYNPVTVLKLQVC